MKVLLILFLSLPIIANAEVIFGPNGVLYGNVCQTQMGWQYVPWQPVGSLCYSPRFNSWGYILNR